jgi:hypothetical protein
MQRAHGRNQPDNAIFVALLAREFFHPGNGSYDFHEKGKRSGVCGAGTLAIKMDYIGGERLGAQLPNHGSDLSAMVRSMIDQMLHR